METLPLKVSCLFVTKLFGGLKSIEGRRTQKKCLFDLFAHALIYSVLYKFHWINFFSPFSRLRVSSSSSTGCGKFGKTLSGSFRQRQSLNGINLIKQNVIFFLLLQLIVIRSACCVAFLSVVGPKRHLKIFYFMYILCTLRSLRSIIQ